MEGYNISIFPNYPAPQSTPPTQTKIHWLFSLVDNMVDFGPTSSFSTES